ncbi:PREDICTED: WD repeat-containing protein 75 [Vollenhovia emeryi]|uniref:WD repeat-containing protein 75 n=1 Tax=Vollenhovia emeryi TaxID=411798 RepID=UPI0005F42610|nr:PREDICTED: WD repeat-containing protein 75 [Vollenhovia emeryi]
MKLVEEEVQVVKEVKLVDASANLAGLDGLIMKNTKGGGKMIVKRKGGGSIIDQRPLFSTDGETLHIVWKNVIRAYSTQTGDFVREFEPSEYRIAGIIAHPDNASVIIGCTENGELHFWNCQSGIITKKLQLKSSLTTGKAKIKTFHIVKYRMAQGNEICQVLVTHFSDCGKKIYVLLFDIETGMCIKSIFIFANSQEYYIDIIGNYGENLIALLHDVDLHILNPARNLVDKIHKTGKTGRLPTCIAGHPEEECVATGDSTGRVVVWKSLFQTRPYTAVFHWHTLPVTEIVFSKSGGHMYTGGGECVLVKWTLANPQHKSFLPRLPAPIKHLTIAPDNLYVAVSTLDNGIVIVNPQRKMTSVIQNFTWGVASSSKDLFPAGLIVDPRTGCLVLNSRTGHVQFYNTHTKNLLYNINITAQNFLTQERNAIIVNTEVTKVAVNHNGTWMATVEERNDKVSSIEVRLKFWLYDLKKQIFVLNTSIELPHENGVNALHFQPDTTFDDGEWLAVTTGKDDKFKLWSLGKSFATEDKDTKHWYCYGVGDYRNLAATDAGFSMDGSLLAIGFHSTLTLWIPETCELKSSLTHSQYNYPITRIEFGKHEACHLVVVVSQQHITVWNILTLAITWTVSLNVVSLACDLKSTYIAAFTSDNSLYVFTPQSATPVYKKTCLIENTSSVLAATFVPHLQEKRDPSFGHWQRKSQLFFLDSNQELLTLEPESEASVSLEIISDKGTMPLTAFSNLIAAQTSSSKEQTVAQVHEHLGTPGKGMLKELLSVPAHTLPPLRLLCTPFILSLAGQSSKNHPRNAENSKDNDDGAQDNASDLSENEVSPPAKPAVTPTNEKEDTDNDDNDVKLIDIDWSFLSNILPDQDNIP